MKQWLVISGINSLISQPEGRYVITRFDLFISSMLVVCEKLVLAPFFPWCQVVIGKCHYCTELSSGLHWMFLLRIAHELHCVLWRFPLLEEYLLEALLPLCRQERLLQISLCFLKMHAIKSLSVNYEFCVSAWWKESVSFDIGIYFSPNHHCVVALSPEVHLCKGLIV